VGLSARGRLQAVALAPVLAACRPAAVIASAMRRARDTAAPVARACGLPLRVEPDLHERRVGALSGTPTGAPDGVWPDTLRRWLVGDTGYAPPGAESFDAIGDRVLPVWDRLAREFEGQTVVVVAHGIVCRVILLTRVSGLTPADWHRLGPVRNAAVHELVLSAGLWHADRLDDLPESVRRAGHGADAGPAGQGG
jgi:probable phosphoglycerate mutase